MALYLPRLACFEPYRSCWLGRDHRRTWNDRCCFSMGWYRLRPPVDQGRLCCLWVRVRSFLAGRSDRHIMFSVSMILTKENAPNAASLGQSNGLVQFTMCFARSFAPFVVRYVCPPSRAGLPSCSSSALFATSLEYNLLGGYLWLVIMIMISFLGMTTSRKIKQNSVKTIG